MVQMSCFDERRQLPVIHLINVCVLVKTKEKMYPNDMGSLPVTSHFRSSFSRGGGKLAFIVSVRSSKTQADPREKFWSSVNQNSHWHKCGEYLSEQKGASK